MEKTDIRQSVQKLDFGKKYDAQIKRIFQLEGIYSIRDLCRQMRQNLTGARYMGEKSVTVIDEVLGKYGLRLNMTDKELDEYTGLSISVQEDAEEAKWEGRRYEIAKALYVHCRISACDAVKGAEKLICELRKQPESHPSPEESKDLD